MFTQLGLGTALGCPTGVPGRASGFGEASDAFLQWGWRIPFLQSAVLIATALFIRLRVKESPAVAAPETHEARRWPSCSAGRAVRCCWPAARRSARRAGVPGRDVLYPFRRRPHGLLHQPGAAGQRDRRAVRGRLRRGLGEVSDAQGAPGDRLRLRTGGAWAFVVFPLIESMNHVVFGVAIVVTYARPASAWGPGAFLPGSSPPATATPGPPFRHAGRRARGRATVVSPMLMASYGGAAIALMMGGRRWSVSSACSRCPKLRPTRR